MTTTLPAKSTRAVSLDELEGETLRHRHGDLFAPPGLTNWLGVTQVDNDLVSVRATTFPPFSTGDAITARAYINGRVVQSYGADVEFSWRADRVLRRSVLGDLDVTTTTVVVPGETALVVDIAITNIGGSTREVSIELVVASSLTKAMRPWNSAISPGELDNIAEPDLARSAVRFTARHSDAICLQGLDRPAVVAGTRLSTSGAIEPGDTWRVAFVQAVGEDGASAESVYDRVAADVTGAIARSAQVWQDELDAMFTPGNDRFGGHLPVLESSNAALRRLYYMGALGVLYFRRDSPYSVLGRTFDTLMPRYWAGTTFLWDYYLSQRVHVLLEPHVMKRHLEHWLATDTHMHYGTEWLTGKPIGCWYSVNDLALTRMLTELVAWGGDDAWWDTTVGAAGAGRSVLAHLERIATNHRTLRQDHGLADYGGIDNLLECVSSYVHAVPSFNAGNVWCLRALAAVKERRGDVEEAVQLRAEADAMAAEVNSLYVDGGGHWRVRHPDGAEVPVRHAMDFFYVTFSMLADLDPKQVDEMVDFFVRELQTPLWMHALSPADPDAMFSARPDHQWNGAYPAWPAESARSLLRMGRDDVAGRWLEGLAATTNQGPFGQAHFAENAVPPDGRGARKAPAEVPWFNDWTCSSSGSWVGMVIDGVFGVEVAADGGVTATPRLAHIDPDARLRGLVVRGASYDVDASGPTRTSSCTR